MKKKNSPSPVDLVQRVRDAGARVTAGRVRALKCLLDAPAPLSHGEVEALLVAEDAPVLDRVTVYRILDDFVTFGLALKSTDSRGVFRFSATAPTVRHDTHVHFRCSTCGRIVCLNTPPPPPPRLPKGFTLECVEVDIRGTCDRCAAA